MFAFLVTFKEGVPGGDRPPGRSVPQVSATTQQKLRLTIAQEKHMIQIRDDAWSHLTDSLVPQSHMGGRPLSQGTLLITQITKEGLLNSGLHNPCQAAF